MQLTAREEISLIVKAFKDFLVLALLSLMLCMSMEYLPRRKTFFCIINIPYVMFHSVEQNRKQNNLHKLNETEQICKEIFYAPESEFFYIHFIRTKFDFPNVHFRPFHKA